jgi:hypothetical protein
MGPLRRHWNFPIGGLSSTRALIPCDAPLTPSCGESCESMFACDLYVHQKCSNYALTKLLFGLCKFVWVIDLLVNLPSFYPKIPARPSTLEVLWARERTPTLTPSIVFTFGLAVESIKEFRGASMIPLSKIIIF